MNYYRKENMIFNFIIKVSKGVYLFSRKCELLAERFRKLPAVPVEYKLFAGQALYKLIREYQFETVLDVGSGEGKHSEVFINSGKVVTAIDYGESVYFRKKSGELECIVADFNSFQFDRQYDCIWCSHVLEHQLDSHLFLTNIHFNLKEGGILAITVPPLKHVIVGGHVSLWNAGLLLYRLVLAGFNCKDASVLTDEYNVSVIVRKSSIKVLDIIEYDSGDVRKIKNYLPPQIKFHPNYNDDPFYGQISQINW